MTPPPQKSFLRRIPRGIWIGGTLIVVVLIGGWIANRGSTAADDLAVGDCFEDPTGLEITKVEDQSCDGLHDAEIIAIVQAPPGMDYPSQFSFTPPGAALGPGEQACIDAVPESDINFANIPDDTVIGFFFPQRSDWDDGKRDLICYLSSVTGMPGPALFSNAG